MPKGKLIAIGVCLWFSTMFLLIGVLLAVHEAIRVEAGKGDSWVFAISIMFLFPSAVAFGVCGAINIYHARARISVGEK